MKSLLVFILGLLGVDLWAADAVEFVAFAETRFEMRFVLRESSSAAVSD